jgi:hypothetical protein
MMQIGALDDSTAISSGELLENNGGIDAGFAGCGGDSLSPG